MHVSDLHPKKARAPIDVTDDGIEILASEKQEAKAESPILFIDGGIEILLSDMHAQKALKSMLSTGGIVNCVNLQQNVQQSRPILIPGCDIKKLMIC